MADNEQTYLSPEQVARRVGVGIDKVKEWMENGLRYFDGGYRTRRIKIEWLEEFTEARSRGGDSASRRDVANEADGTEGAK